MPVPERPAVRNGSEDDDRAHKRLIAESMARLSTQEQSDYWAAYTYRRSNSLELLSASVPRTTKGS